MRLVFLGPPGAGKGTVAKLLKTRLQVPHVGSGDLLRDSVRRKDPVGEKVGQLMKEGILVPDALVTGLVLRHLEEIGATQHFVLDGFPRTVEQGRTLDETLARASHAPIDLAVDFEIPDAVAVTRLAGRRICSGCGANYHQVTLPPRQEGVCDRCGSPLTTRPDDLEETILKRLDVYRSQTQPLVGFYRSQGKLRGLSGETGIEEQYEGLLRLLKNEHLIG